MLSHGEVAQNLLSGARICIFHLGRTVCTCRRIEPDVAAELSFVRHQFDATVFGKVRCSTAYKSRKYNEKGFN